MGQSITVTVNGTVHTAEVEPRMLLVHFLREQLNLTGTHIGCDTSTCGCCETALACSLLAVQCNGSEVRTVEDLQGEDGTLHPIQQAFHENHGLQCGFCTPGMMMAALGVIEQQPDASDDEIREALEGNLCRCTGYQNIVKSVLWAAEKMRAQNGEEA
jgi:carbon-monoxide dehydrogenase small subunit